MNRRRFNPEEITIFLQQAASGIPIKDLFSKHGFTEQTYYRWKRQYAGMGTAEVREFQKTRKENAQFKKKLLADLTLDKQMLQEVLKKKF